PARLDAPWSTVSIQLLAGGAFAPSDSGVVQGSLGAEWGAIEPWGLQVEGGIQSYRSGPFTAGTLHPHPRWAGAGLRRAFYVWGRSGFVGSIGGRFERIAVTDGDPADARDVFTAAGVAALEWRQVVKYGFFFAARTSAEVRLRAEGFSAGSTPRALV